MTSLHIFVVYSGWRYLPSLVDWLGPAKPIVSNYCTAVLVCVVVAVMFSHRLLHVTFHSWQTHVMQQQIHKVWL